MAANPLDLYIAKLENIDIMAKQVKRDLTEIGNASMTTNDANALSALNNSATKLLANLQRLKSEYATVSAQMNTAAAGGTNNLENKALADQLRTASTNRISMENQALVAELRRISANRVGSPVTQTAEQSGGLFGPGGFREGVPTISEAGRTRGATGNIPVKVEAQSLTNKQQQLAEEKAAQELRNKNLRALAEAEGKAALRVAQDAGYSVNDLKSTLQASAGGPKQYNFAKDNQATGATERLKVTQDQYGNVSSQIPRNLSTFTQGVVKDIAELTKWSIAMSVIYLPMQKLGEITQLMIANEVKLAEATIAVNSEFVSSADIFNAAADAANNAGEEINTTIAAFTAAYRATGGGASESTRFTTAQTLLADSMTLAKLAGIDESVAIDTLSASLRQSGMALTDGSTLLDKWVRTSQIANVDINTLASGFAIMGDTADAAGLSVDQLNGLLATVAETGLASGKEAANATRRVVSSFQTPGAVAELQRLGIATEDANGKAKSFLEIGQQIYAMRQKNAQGKSLMSDDDYKNLTFIAGQGIRGQATLSTVLTNFNRIGEISAQSATTQGGEAAGALEKQLTTAQTAMTRFNNSFQELAQTLGTKGGILDIFKLLTNGGTGFVNVLTSIIGVFGKSTPMIIAATAAMVAYYRKPAEARALTRATMGDGFGQFAMGAMGGGKYSDPTNSKIIDPQMLQAQRFSSFLTSGGDSAGRGGKVGFGAGAGIAVGMIPAAMNLAAGDKDKALADMGGAIAGGIVGNMIAPGAGGLIGATIGTSMAEIFLSLTKVTLDQWATSTGTASTPGEDLNLTPEQKKLRDESRTATENEKLKKQYEDRIVSGVAGGGGLINARSGAYNTFIERVNKLVAAGDESGVKKEYGSKYGPGQMLNGTPYSLQEALKLLPVDGVRGAGQFNPMSNVQIASTLTTDKEAVMLRDAIIKVQTDSGQNPMSTKFADTLTPFKDKYGAQIETLIGNQITSLTKSRISGDVNQSTYLGQAGAASGFGNTAPTWLAALGSDNFDTKKLQEYLDVATYGATEAKDNITKLATDLINLRNETDATTDPAKIQRIKDYQAALASGIASEALNVKISRAGIQPIANDLNAPYTSQQWGGIEAGAKKRAKEYYMSPQGGGMTSAEADKYLLDTFKTIAILIKDAGKEFYKTASGVDPQFMQAEIKAQTDSGQLPSASNTGSDILSLNATGAQYKQMESIYPAFVKKMEGLGYQSKPETQIVKLTDKDYMSDRKDFKLVQLLLGEIADNTQGTLDGMFNLPEGASFMVNLAAAKMHMDTVNGMGTGLPAADGTMTPTPDTAGIALANANIAQVQAKGGYTRSMDTKVGRMDQLSAYPESYKQAIALPRDNPAWDKMPDYSKPLPRDNAAWDQLSGNQAATPITTKFDISFESTTMLVVDGRTLATVIKPYLASDMVQSQQSQSTVVRSYVI